jgi:hypothetical protein
MPRAALERLLALQQNRRVADAHLDAARQNRFEKILQLLLVLGLTAHNPHAFGEIERAEGFVVNENAFDLQEFQESHEKFSLLP